MREHHAFRIAGAAGGVLQETDLAGAAANGDEGGRLRREIRGHEHGAQRFHLRAQQPRERLRLRNRDHDRGAGALQYADVPGHVVFDLRQARRRIQRHRNAAGEQHAVEAVQVIGGRRQHDGDRLPWGEARIGEPRGVAQSPLPQGAIAQPILFLLLIQEDGQAIRLPLDVVLERLDQGLRVIGRPHALRLREARHRAVGGLRRLTGAREQKAQQVARRLARGERLLGEAGGKFALQAQHQLDPRQAVQAEIALERAVEGDVRLDVRPRLARHFGDDA